MGKDEKKIKAWTRKNKGLFGKGLITEIILQNVTFLHFHHTDDSRSTTRGPLWPCITPLADTWEFV